MAKHYAFTPKSLAAALTEIRTQLVLNAVGDYFVLCIVKAVDYIDVLAEHSERPLARPNMKSL